MKIYACKGKHFKVYNSHQNQVLENPSDTEEVDVEFNLDNAHLVIFVRGYIQTKMRFAGQKNRIDLYILPENFYPLLDKLKKHLARISIQHAPLKSWRFSKPIPREGRQGVPSLVKLAEIINVSALVPIIPQMVKVGGATALIDSEVPGEQQAKWKREGGTRQVHIGIFGGVWTREARVNPEKEVVVFIPLSEVKNNFIDSIEKFWVSG